MEPIKLKSEPLLDTLLIVFPVTIQIYNIVASKLGVQTLDGNLISLVFLFIASIYLFLKHTYILTTIKEFKLAVLFSITSLPAILFHMGSDIDAIARSFCSIGFVPLGFAIGAILSLSYKTANDKKKFIYNFLLLIPIFSVTIMMQSMQTLMDGTDFGRDAILSVSIFLPLILAINIKYLRGILLIPILYWSIISAKRTSILCVLLAYIFLMLPNILNISIRNCFRFIFAITFFFIVVNIAYNKYTNFAEQIDFIIERFENPEDNASNNARIDMYERTYSAFRSSSFAKQLFGHGYKAVEKDLFGNPSHNDLLEILYDFGLIALIIYIIFLFKLLLNGFKLLYINRNNFLLSFTMCNIFLLSMINCMITNPVFVFINMFCAGFSLNYYQE